MNDENLLSHSPLYWPPEQPTWMVKELRFGSIVWILTIRLLEWRGSEGDRAKSDLAELARVTAQQTEEHDLFRPLVVVLDGADIDGKQEWVKQWRAWAADAEWHRGDFLLFVPEEEDFSSADEVTHSLFRPLSQSNEQQQFQATIRFKSLKDYQEDLRGKVEKAKEQTEGWKALAREFIDAAFVEVNMQADEQDEELGGNPVKLSAEGIYSFYSYLRQTAAASLKPLRAEGETVTRTDVIRGKPPRPH